MKFWSARRLCLRPSTLQVVLGLATNLVVVPVALALDADIIPSKLLSKSNDSINERKGWFLSPEPKNDWIARLIQSPLKVERVFLRHDPLVRRWNDYDLLVCLNRKLADIEQGRSGGISYYYDYVINFSDGTAVRQGFGSYKNELSSSSLIIDRESRLVYRCFTIGEGIMHPGMRWDDMSVAGDRMFRTGGIKSVAIRLHRKGIYGDTLVHQFKTEEIHAYERATRSVFSEHGYYEGQSKITTDFRRGRIQGEIFYLSQKCADIRPATAITPPSETDRTEYALGFKAGFQLGDAFRLKHRKACETALNLFGPNGYERAGLLNAK